MVVIKLFIHQNQTAGLWTICNENVNFGIINNEQVDYYGLQMTAPKNTTIPTRAGTPAFLPTHTVECL